MSRKAIHQLLDVLKEYQSLGIAEQIDYDKFYLYSTCIGNKTKEIFTS